MPLHVFLLPSAGGTATSPSMLSWRDGLRAALLARPAPPALAQVTCLSKAKPALIAQVKAVGAGDTVALVGFSKGSRVCLEAVAALGGAPVACVVAAGFPLYGDADKTSRAGELTAFAALPGACPCLLLSGGRDTMLRPAKGKGASADTATLAAAAAAMPAGSRLELVAGADHSLLVGDSREASLQAMAAFITAHHAAGGGGGGAGGGGGGGGGPGGSASGGGGGGGGGKRRKVKE